MHVVHIQGKQRKISKKDEEMLLAQNWVMKQKAIDRRKAVKMFSQPAEELPEPVASKIGNIKIGA